MKNKKTTYVIAEAGVNHNGSVRLAKKLIDVAANAGADAVKFQTFRAGPSSPQQCRKQSISGVTGRADSRSLRC